MKSANTGNHSEIAVSFDDGIQQIGAQVSLRSSLQANFRRSAIVSSGGGW